jgi:tRNA threonylcarbamoyladenosine modification (KEOPS) complex  Pcc1 subunit
MECMPTLSSLASLSPFVASAHTPLTHSSIPMEATQIWSAMLKHLPGDPFHDLLQIVAQQPADAVATAIYLAASPEVETKDQKGKFFLSTTKEDINVVWTSDDWTAAKTAWSETSRCVCEGMYFFFSILENLKEMNGLGLMNLQSLQQNISVRLTSTGTLCTYDDTRAEGRGTTEERRGSTVDEQMPDMVGYHQTL